MMHCALIVFLLYCWIVIQGHASSLYAEREVSRYRIVGRYSIQFYQHHTHHMHIVIYYKYWWYWL